jgi:hypothetical protein
MKTRKEKLSWTPAATVLSGMIASLPGAARLKEYRVWEVWDEVVGDAVARKARPSKIHNGKLFVTVSNSVYMQELQFSKATIREKLNQRLGSATVKEILFFIGRPGDAVPRPAASPRQPLPPFSELNVPPLDRPELEAAFTRLLEARRRRLSKKDVRG